MGAKYQKDKTITSADEFHYQASKLMKSHFIKEVYNDSYLFDDLYKTTNIILISAVTADYFAHMWVADGYLALESTITYSEYGVTQWSKNEITGKYVHHNWGKNGGYNGYIIDGVFDFEGESYDFLKPLKSRDEFVDFFHCSHYKK